LRRQLACDGVDLSAVVATDALTTLAMVQVDCAGVARYRFTSVRRPVLTVEEASAALSAESTRFIWERSVWSWNPVRRRSRRFSATSTTARSSPSIRIVGRQRTPMARGTAAG